MGRVLICLAVLSAMIVAATPAAGVPRPGFETQPLLLRLPDVGNGYRVGDDSGCGGLGTEGAPPSVAQLTIAYRPTVCSIEFERLWRDPKAPAGGAVLVESSALLFPTADGTSAALRVARDLAGYMLGPEGLDQVSEQLKIGEEAAAFTGKGRFTVVWRRGAVLALVHVHNATSGAARTAALSLAGVQETRIERPTPLPKGINDDREVALDDPHLGVPVYWLGRSFSSGNGLPKLTLWQSREKVQLDPGHLLAAQIDYIGGVELDHWRPAKWARFRSSRFGRAEPWNSPCAEKRTLRLRRGHADLFAGYAARKPSRTAPGPDARAARRCPTRSPDEFVAHVYLPHVLVEVKTDGRYESFKALSAVVRSLRLRRSR